MELSHVLSDLAVTDSAGLCEILRPHWEDSVASVPPDWDLLQPAQCRSACIAARCGDEVAAPLARATAVIASRPALRLLAWHCHRLIFETPDYTAFPDWRALMAPLDRIHPGLGGTFILWLALGAAPRLYARHGEQGVPQEISRDTLHDIAIAVRRYARYNDGAIGVEPRLLSWHRLVASGDLYRVGRFEYVVRPFHGRLRALRHLDSGCVLALSENGIEYDAAGQLAGSGQTPAWSTPLVETETKLRGHPISPRGFALPEPVELNRADWECVLAPEEMVLEIHIPEGEPLTPQSCRDSFERAREFFTTRYPEYSVRAFACYSWLFNTQFEEMLPADSKMLAWQRECYLFPFVSSGRDGLYFVFGSDEIDPATAPRDTLLRRAIADHLQSGKKLRSGGMFFCFDDLSRYGTQVYREMEKQLQDTAMYENSVSSQ